MKKRSILNFFSTYSPPEWIGIKATLCLFWLGIVWFTSINQDNLPYPTGICRLFNCSILTSHYTFVTFLVISVTLSILYLLEKWMFITTLLMFLTSLLFFTLEESNGILNYNGLYTMIFLVQAFAYFRNNDNIKIERVQFPIQIIAAGYMLAGIAKLKESGLSWITEAPQASIQILKNYCYAYFDTGDIHYMDKGMKLANFVLENVFFAKMLFAISLFLELFAWIAIKNKQTALIYGLLLTAMHIGILYIMHILIFSIFMPMLIFLVNPLGLGFLAIHNLVSRNKISPHSLF